MLTADCRARALSVVPLTDADRSITTLARAAIARVARTCNPLGARSSVVMPLPASAGGLSGYGGGPTPGVVTVTTEPPPFRHPDSSLSSCDRAAGGSRNAATTSTTWIDLRKVCVSENPAAWYPRMASTSYTSGVPGEMLPQPSARSTDPLLSDLPGCAQVGPASRFWSSVMFFR